MPRKIRFWTLWLLLAGAALGSGCQNGAPKSAGSRDENRVEDSFKFHQPVSDPAFGR